MNKQAANHSWIPGIILSVLILSSSFFSCKKEEPTKAVIAVNDSVGNAVAGASVTLYQDTSVNTTTGQKANVRVTGNTDSNGKVEFTFTLEAYLNIEAVKGGKKAKGFIRLKEHETVSQTVHF